MAWEIMGLVFDMPITNEFTSALKFTAMVYANYAKSDGTDSYPSRQTVSRITGFHERSIQRYQRELIRLGVLVPDGMGKKGTNKYRFPVESIAGELSLDIPFLRGDTVSPPADVSHSRGDNASGDNASGGRVSPKPNKPFETATSTIPFEKEIEKKKEKKKDVLPLLLLQTFKSELGHITPIIEKDLLKAIGAYSQEWVIDAMEEAVLNNKRNWKYCKAILTRWKEEGRQETREDTRRESVSAHRITRSPNRKRQHDKPRKLSPSL